MSPYLQQQQQPQPQQQQQQQQQQQLEFRSFQQLLNNDKELHPVINITYPVCLTDFSVHTKKINGGMWLKICG